MCNVEQLEEPQRVFRQDAAWIGRLGQHSGAQENLRVKAGG